MKTSARARRPCRNPSPVGRPGKKQENRRRQHPYTAHEYARDDVIDSMGSALGHAPRAGFWCVPAAVGVLGHGKNPCLGPVVNPKGRLNAAIGSTNAQEVPKKCGTFQVVFRAMASTMLTLKVSTPYTSVADRPGKRRKDARAEHRKEDSHPRRRRSAPPAAVPLRRV